MVDYIYDRWQRLSADRLEARYANDNTALALSGGLTATQFHNNDNLPNGVVVHYAEPIVKTHTPYHRVAQAQQSMGCKVNALVKPEDRAYFMKQCARIWWDHAYGEQ